VAQTEAGSRVLQQSIRVNLWNTGLKIW